MERCQQCKRAVSDDWFSRLPMHGADWEAIQLCDECLTLLEIGQGLVEDRQFRAEWDAMIQECKDAEGEYYQAGYPEKDKAKAIRRYQAVTQGC
jgi:hypothetical protein